MPWPSPLAGTVAEAAFWAASALVLYTYAGYPLLIALAARLRPSPVLRKADHEPSVSVIVVARDEEDCIEAKLTNCLSFDYPRERLEILVASDGSEDRTESIVAGFADRGVRLLALPAARGKASALNAAVAEARGEILLLTDASEQVAVDAARELVANFADPSVGAVSGELHLTPREGDETSEGVGLYWRYEKSIRRNESRFDSTVGVTGGLCALRRELFVALDPRTILDDVAIPMEVALAGHRVVFEPRARAWDQLGGSLRQEYRRKKRTLAGNYQLLWLRPALLHPARNRLFWQLLSHKVARLAVPWCLLVTLLTSALLARRASPFYAVALTLQIGFYLLAGGGGLATGYRSRALKLPYTFVVLNLAAMGGLFDFLRGRASVNWKVGTPRGSV